MNYTNILIGAESPCYSGGALKAECIIKQFCPQFPAYFLNASLWLLGAYVAIDFIIPLLMLRVVPKLHLDGFYNALPWLQKRVDLRQEAHRAAVVAFLKDKLLFACALLIGWLAYFSYITR